MFFVLKTFLGLSLLTMIMAGCAQNPATADGTAVPGDGTATDEIPRGETPMAVGPDGKPSRLADVIDFGAAPKGAAALSSVTCPALAMPKASSAPVVYIDANATG